MVARLVSSVSVFKDMTEKTRSTISNRSLKLFTLSSIYQATRKLLGIGNGDPVSDDAEQLAHEFWTEVAKHIPDWHHAADRTVNSSELRRDYVHAHGIALQALATAGAALIEAEPTRWRSKLAKLKSIDWSRANSKTWEGRALVMGRVSKAQTNVTLTSNLIKNQLGVALTADEQELENAYEHGCARQLH
jgi:DNA sulfur modification protein DndB